MEITKCLHILIPSLLSISLSHFLPLNFLSPAFLSNDQLDFRSYVYLSNLLIPLLLVQKVAIVSDKGDVKGHLTVSVKHMAGTVVISCASLPSK